MKNIKSMMIKIILKHLMTCEVSLDYEKSLFKRINKPSCHIMIDKTRSLTYSIYLKCQDAESGFRCAFYIKRKLFDQEFLGNKGGEM